MPAVLVWLVTLLVAAGMVWTAAPASAHATVLSSSPADGSHVDEPPTVLSFELTEAATLVDGSAQLIDSDGARQPIAVEPAEDGGRRILLVPERNIPDGAYLATARVVSADTHVVSLSIRFTVGSVTEFGQELDTSVARAGPEQYLGYASKAAEYLGVILSSGLFVAGRWVWPSALSGRRFRTAYRIGAGLLVAGLFGRFMALVAQQAGGLSDTSVAAATTVLGSLLGIAIVVAAVLTLVCCALPPGRVRVADAAGYLQMASAVVAVTLGGHGGSTERWPLSFVSTSAHVYASAFWFGGVCVLALVLEDVPQLARWHRVVAGHVALVAATGLVLAMLQVRPAAALFFTSYGVTLLVKVALGALVACAGHLTYRRYRNRTALPVAGPPPVARRPWTLVVEAGLAVMVVAATSLLSSLTPAKDSYTTSARTELDFGASEILDVEIDSVRRGSQTLTVRYPRANGESGSGKDLPDLDVEFSSVQANIARMPVELTRTGAEGNALVWTSDGLIVPTAGQWKVTVRFDAGHGPKLASFYYEAL